MILCGVASRERERETISASVTPIRLDITCCLCLSSSRVCSSSGRSLSIVLVTGEKEGSSKEEPLNGDDYYYFLFSLIVSSSSFDFYMLVGIDINNLRDGPALCTVPLPLSIVFCLDRKEREKDSRVNNVRVFLSSPVE